MFEQKKECVVLISGMLQQFCDISMDLYKEVMIMISYFMFIVLFDSIALFTM